MKLILCPECMCIFRLSRDLKRCDCGISYGKYVDSSKVVISNSAVALAIHNEHLVIAYQKYKSAMEGKNNKRWATPIKSWIMIDKNCPNVERNDEINSCSASENNVKTSTQQEL